MDFLSKKDARWLIDSSAVDRKWANCCSNKQHYATDEHAPNKQRLLLELFQLYATFGTAPDQRTARIPITLIHQHTESANSEQEQQKDQETQSTDQTEEVRRPGAGRRSDDHAKIHTKRARRDPGP